MTYTLKSNATTATAKVVFVGENGLANLASGGGAVTATGTIAASTVDGKVVYGSAQTTTGNYLQVASVPAIPSGASKWCVLLVGNFGSNVSADQGIFAAGPSQTTWVGTAASPVRTAAQHGGVGGPYGGATVTGYAHPASASVLHAMIYGRDTGPTVLSSYYNGARSVDYSGAFAADGSVAAGAWRFGGRPVSGTGGFGIGIFAVFIGTSPSELAAYIAANGTGTTEADKVYSALLEVVAGGTAPSITTQPSSASVAAGATATFTAAASGSPAPTYQWQRNPGGVGSWADIASATSASYTTPATTVSGGSANNGDTYRVVATNASGSATSTAATLTVGAANAAPTFAGPSISNLSITQGAAMTSVNVAGRFSDTDSLTFSAIGTWPAGVTVSSAGVISGTPTVVGNYTSLQVRATDTAAQTVDSNTFSIAVTAVTATLNFQATGMEFGARTGLGISTFALDVGSGYRYTVHADGLTLGAALYTSGVVTTDSAGKLPNLVDASITAGVMYRVHAVRQSDGAAATFKMVAA